VVGSRSETWKPRAVAGSPSRNGRYRSLLPPPQYVMRDGEDVPRRPLHQIRKTIAKRLATSLGPHPHFFLTTEIDMERAERGAATP